MSWDSYMKRAVQDIGAELDKTASKEQIDAAFKAGYPIGDRTGYPYRQWLIHKRDYCRTRWPEFYAKQNQMPAAFRAKWEKWEQSCKKRKDAQ